jgi:hypothetical protein
MKKFFALVAIFVLVLAACDPSDEKSNGNGDGGTTLIVKNLTDYDFSNVTYSTTSFGTIRSGGNQKKTVTAGTTKPVSFVLVLEHIGTSVGCETNAITVNEGEGREITISDNTTVTAEGRGSNTIENVVYLMEAESGKH